jgi:hypothetical protein
MFVFDKVVTFKIGNYKKKKRVTLSDGLSTSFIQKYLFKWFQVAPPEQKL